MIPKHPENTTRLLGAPRNWNPARDGYCSHLAVVDMVDDLGKQVMVSVWEPTPGELAALNAGKHVHLEIVGTQHPPVFVWVEE
jgi:hypothetical protein